MRCETTPPRDTAWADALHAGRAPAPRRQLPATATATATATAPDRDRQHRLHRRPPGSNDDFAR